MAVDDSLTDGADFTAQRTMRTTRIYRSAVPATYCVMRRWSGGAVSQSSSPAPKPSSSATGGFLAGGGGGLAGLRVGASVFGFAGARLTGFSTAGLRAAGFSTAGLAALLRSGGLTGRSADFWGASFRGM